MKRLLLFAIVLGTMWESAFAYDFKVGNLYYNVISNADLTVEVTSQYEDWHNGVRFYYYKSGYIYSSYFRSGFYDYYDAGDWDSYGDRSNHYADEARQQYIPCTDPYGSITIPSTIRYQNVTFTVTRIGKHAFYGCRYITDVNIPVTISQIDSSAFYGCSGITSVLIEGDLTSIGSSSFENCSYLNTFTSNGELSTIGDNAYQNCSRLTTLNIPYGLENIGNSAFAGCSLLTTIHFDNIITPPNVGTNALSGIPLFAFIYVPCASISTYQQNTTWNQFSHYSGIGAMGNLNVSSQDSSYGSVSITDSAGCNSPATILATSNYGYHFFSWNDGNTDNPRVVNVLYDTSFVSYYERNRYYVLGESTNNSRGVVQGSDSAYYLDSLTLTPMANYGYVFSHWNDDVTDNPRKVEVSGDMTYYATFEPAPFTITVLPSDSTMGYTTGSGTVYYGNSVLIRAYANNGYRFIGWNDGYSLYSRSVYVTSDTTFTALFEPIPQYVIYVGSNNSTMGTVSGGGTHYENTNISISATPNTGCRFTGWSDGVSTNPRTIYVYQDTAFTAMFEYIDYIIKAQTNNSLRGTVDGTDTVHYGETVTLIATPNEHFTFQYWQSSNGTTHGDNPLTLTVTSSGTYTAYFAAEQHSVAVYSDGGGTVRISNSGNIGNYDYFSQLTLTATANGNNAFLRWSDGNSFNPRTVTVTQDTTFTALFLNGTTYLHDTIIDTVYFNHYTHDTTFINNYIHDTVRYTTYVIDTTIVNIHQFDTTINNYYQYDTVFINNYQHDTTLRYVYDTVYLLRYLTDTVFIHDTIFTTDGINNVDVLNAKVYSNRGKIFVEGADGNTVTLFDINGRILATKQDYYSQLVFYAPASGTYLIKIGNHPARKVVVIR